MSEVVSSRSRDGVCVITVDNPPVNALGIAVRQGLQAALKDAAADPAVRAVVIACAGRSFFSGADIREIDKPPQPPRLREIFAQIEEGTKPVIAAIHGNALGGGLEFALCCHFRIATRSTKLGLPEVKLGILPGAGGTQRLPRAVGPVKAVQMIVSGEPILGEEALAEGLVDDLFEGDPAAAGEAFAREVLAEKRPLRRLRDSDEKLAAARADRRIFTDAVAAATKRLRGLKAPLVAAEAVGYIFDRSFDEGIDGEAERFAELRNSEQAKAQRYAFFAERAAAKVPGLSAETAPRKVERVAVIGAGTMGGGIAMALANAGVPVTLIEQAEEPLGRGLGIIRKNYQATAARGGMTADEVEERVGLISGKVGLEQAGDADLVIEAVFETMAVKRDVFTALDAIARPGAVLASNTSYLSIDEIAAVTKRPQDMLGMHFFSPANVMKLCEIVRGADTAPDALATAVAIARKMGKVPVVVGNCPGFVGNRMIRQRSQQAEKMLSEGALPEQIDAVITKFGMPMGPFAMIDLAGHEIGWRSRRDRGVTSEIADALYEQGRRGQMNRRGYYRYEEGSRTPLPDPEVATLIAQTLERRGVTPRAISEEEIFERLIYPIINEGARVLEEGIAARSGDIDVVWIYGYSWPVYRGGPMYYADTVGLKKIADRLEHYAGQTGDASLQPAKLLRSLGEQGRTFASLGAGG